MSIEWLGILATCVIFLSFTMKDSRHIRAVNIVGSILFIVYGVAIGALSVWLLNGACVLLNTIQLCKRTDD